MGWLFGAAVRDPARRSFEALERIHEPPRHVVRTTSVYAACGGPGLGCRSSAADQRAREAVADGWIVAGNACEVESGRAKPFGDDEWRRTFERGAESFRMLDGDFVAARLGQHTFELFTDPLGARPLFVAKVPFGVAFSTRIDWLARAAGGFEVDAAALGPLVCRTHSAASGLKGARRIGAGGVVSGDARAYRVSESPWLPDRAPHDPTEYRDCVRAFVRPQLPDRLSVSVGLSGGVDSRLMLALTAPGDAISAHVLGYVDEPDVEVAKRVASARGVPIVSYPHEVLPGPDETFALIRTGVALTHGMVPASTLPEKRRYAEIGAPGKLLLVGMFGELARRQFHGVYAMRHAATRLVRRDADVLPQHFTTPPLPFFEPGHAGRMHESALLAVRLLFETMPRERDIGLEGFLDLLAVRTQLPAGYAAHQNLLGHLASGYSPFAQQSVLRAAFGLPLHARRNSRAVFDIIRQTFPDAARIPLVANDTRYRFGASTFGAQLCTRIRRRYSHYARARHDVLATVEAAVREMASSADVRSVDLYNMPRVDAAMDRFYAAVERGSVEEIVRSRSDDAALIDGWLTFELWRQAASGTATWNDPPGR